MSAGWFDEKYSLSILTLRNTPYTLDMSIKNPHWYELPKERWRERTWTDSQKQKLYDAENCFKRLFAGRYKEFDTLKEVQRYVDKFLKSAWVTRRWGEQESVTVYERLGNICDASKWRNRIRLNHWGMNEIVVLHELCHIVTPSGTGVSHGRYYARTFLEVIGHVLGAEAKKVLRKEYIRGHVKCTPRPVYSEKTKAAMRVRGLKIAIKMGWSK